MIGRILVAILFVCAIQMAQASDSVRVQEQQESQQTLEHSQEQEDHGADAANSVSDHGMGDDD